MAYSTGSTILDDDYNGFATNVNTIWGAGSGSSGYGQATTVSAVAPGNTITATQWTTLLARISSAANHQGSSITAITNPSVGNTISVLTALSGNITTITNNKLNAAANGADLTTNGTTSTTSAWGVSATTSKTITFASSTAARYFFNAGGMIRISFARSGGTAQPKNTAWTNLLNAVGTIVWTGYATNKTIAGTTFAGITKIGGSGSTSVFNNTGILEMSSVNTERFKQLDATYLYTSNFVSVSTQWSGTVFTMNVTLSDVDTDPETVDGTLTMTTVIRPPSTTYLTNTWGTPTQNAATWSLT